MMGVDLTWPFLETFHEVRVATMISLELALPSLGLFHKVQLSSCDIASKPLS